MTWLCPVCSTSNVDDNTECLVCGTLKPALSGKSKSGSLSVSSKKSSKKVKKSDDKECKVVFSMFSDIGESVKSFFSGFGSSMEDIPEDEVAEVKKTSSKDKVISKTKDKSSKKKPKAEPVKETSGTDSSLTGSSPWPEHSIEFDEDVIASKGYVRYEQAVLDGIRGYKFYKADRCQFIRVEMVLIQKLARKI